MGNVGVVGSVGSVGTDGESVGDPVGLTVGEADVFEGGVGGRVGPVPDVRRLGEGVGETDGSSGEPGPVREEVGPLVGKTVGDSVGDSDGSSVK